MLRSIVLSVLTCLPVLGCAASSFVAADAPDALIVPRALSIPDAPDSSGWTTESFGVAAPVAAAQDYDDDDDVLDDMDDRHFTVMLGERQLDDDEWDPVEDQLAVGLAFDARNSSTGHGFEIGTTYSQDDDDDGPVDVDGNVFEIYGGYRYTFNLDFDHDGHDAHDDDLDDDDFDDRLHPYLGAGGSLLRAEVEVDGPGGDDSDDDFSPAAYIRAGVGYDLSEEFRLGLDYRHLFLSDVDIGSIDDVDFDMFMLTLGFDF